MDYLHYKVSVRQGEVIRVTLDEKADISRASVRLLDTLNYYKYSAGKKYTETAGASRQSPLKLTPPYKGQWHVVVDLGSGGGSLKARVDVIPGEPG